MFYKVMATRSAALVALITDGPILYEKCRWLHLMDIISALMLVNFNQFD